MKLILFICQLYLNKEKKKESVKNDTYAEGKKSQSMENIPEIVKIFQLAL